MTAFSDADVQLVAQALTDATGYTIDASDTINAARSALAALADAGRLVPADMEHFTEAAVQFDDQGSKEIEREVYAGPWVEADGTP